MEGRNRVDTHVDVGTGPFDLEQMQHIKGNEYTIRLQLWRRIWMTDI